MSNSSLLGERKWDGKFYSGGWVTGGGPALTVTDKATDESLGSIALATSADVHRAAELATEAQPGWAAMSAVDRRAVFVQVARLMDDNREEIVNLIVRESGSVPAKAEFEFKMSMDEILEAAAMPTQPIGELMPASQPGTTSIARRVPRGVVGIIAPWNFPVVLSLRSVAPALALGNAVILKPARETPLCGGYIFAELFERAGLPANVLHVLAGDSTMGDALITDPLVRTISFTGSTEVGRHVAVLAAPLLKKVALELGGNNPFVVLEDADLEAATSCGAWGSYLHQGQICMTTGRHIVHEKIADQYVRRLAERAQCLPCGDPNKEQVALGPIINEGQVKNIQRIVDETVKAGATLVTGGKAVGKYYQPTVLANVTRDMPAFKEEIFGPVAAVTTFKTDEEAVELANDTIYGLTAGVMGSKDRAMKVAQQIKSGMIHVNDQSIDYESYIPYGGSRDSGNGGRFGAAASIEEFTEWHWTTIKDEPAVYPF